MPATDSTYIAQTSARIVQMFQLYAQVIDPKSEHFLMYITEYLQTKNVTNPRAVSYPELYMLIKEGIRGYMHQRESSGRSSRFDVKSR